MCCCHCDNTEPLDEQIIQKLNLKNGLPTSHSVTDLTNHQLSRYAHDAYTSFLEKRGFEVTRHYLLETAWVATYTHGKGGRVLGVNSEMDALPGIGHACGHNLIGVAGVAVACAAKAAMEKLNIDGKVVLLGTPGMLWRTENDELMMYSLYSGGRWIWQGEIVGEGSIQRDGRVSHVCGHACLTTVGSLLICVRDRCHPAPGPLHSISLSSCLAVIRLEVEYSGHTCGLPTPYLL